MKVRGSKRLLEGLWSHSACLHIRTARMAWPAIRWHDAATGLTIAGCTTIRIYHPSQCCSAGALGSHLISGAREIVLCR